MSDGKEEKGTKSQPFEKQWAIRRIVVWAFRYRHRKKSTAMYGVLGEALIYPQPIDESSHTRHTWSYHPSYILCYVWPPIYLLVLSRADVQAPRLCIVLILVEKDNLIDIFWLEGKTCMLSHHFCVGACYSMISLAMYDYACSSYTCLDTLTLRLNVDCTCWWAGTKAVQTCLRHGLRREIKSTITVGTRWRTGLWIIFIHFREI